MKLNVGCRSDLLDGYDNIDLYYVADGVKNMDMITLPEYEAESVDEIYAKDVLEHITFMDVDAAFKRWYEVLKVGGVVKIRTPDMDYLFGHYDTNNSGTLRSLFGSQEDPGQFHKSGFNENMIRKWLEKYYFHSFKRVRSTDGDLYVTVIK